jgi:hypothetical protein
MVGSSKILTVSYGTFSCTLEGFDDSFETMKAIAEYFRDLAADDRYFGAEPPTPDADMLARIAEREVARRVEAHEHEGRIVLRAQDNAQAGRALAAALNRAPQPEDPAPARQAAAAGGPASEGPEAEEPEADMPWQAEAGEAEPEVEDAGAPASVAGADNLSARLDLIRSVVGVSESYDEDEHAQDFADSAGEPMAWDEPGETAEAEAVEAEDVEAEAVQAEAGDAGAVEAEPELAEAFEADEDAGPVPAASEDSLFEDTLAALLADAAPVAEAEAPEADAAGPQDAAPQAASDGRGARVLKVSRADLEAARAGGLLDAGDEAGEDTVNIFDDDAATLSPEDEADLQRELASLDAELGDEIGPEDVAEDAAEDAAEGDDAPVAAMDQPEPAPARASHPEGGKRTEVSRIFDETDNQMADPGSVRRRNTIQHLRAALAATRAEKAAGTDLAKKIDATPYRGDLDAAVRPRRAMPAPDAPRSARPEEQRAAPLKLVAEQRVDKPRGPVRPRRVTIPPTTDLADLVETQQQGFPAFAEEMGATDLPDVLEAAAAYLADVEGRSQFSRPMLMGKLREIDEEGFSREDGLRSFGQLLREGKLQKLAGGRFAVTGETEFRAAARRRAG